MPQTCRDGDRRSSTPYGRPISSCSPAESSDVYSYRKNSRFPYNRRYDFFAVVRKYGQGGVTGTSQIFQITESSRAGNRQELLGIKPKDEKKGFAGFSCHYSSKGRSLDAVLEKSQGILSLFFFSLVWFHFRENGLSVKDCWKRPARCGKRNYKKSRYRWYSRKGIR